VRGWYEITSKLDPRFNKIGKDFICPYRGAMNFDRMAWVEKCCKKYGVDAPADLRYFVFWDGEQGEDGAEK
jgi:hypothetical protein